jgi:hypothetical protein
MTFAVLSTLLLFGGLSSIASGVAYAVARARVVNEAEQDARMRLVAASLLLFGAASTYAAVGLSGVVAYAGVLAWFSYMLSARQLDVVSIRPPERRFATHVSQP